VPNLHRNASGTAGALNKLRIADRDKHTTSIVLSIGVSISRQYFSFLSLPVAYIIFLLRRCLLLGEISTLLPSSYQPFLEMASAASLPLKSIAFVSSIILAAGGSRIQYRDLLVRTFTGPGSYKRTALIALLLINIKNWPFVWTVSGLASCHMQNEDIRNANMNSPGSSLQCHRVPLCGQ
jgi:hypothetical protein